MSAGDRPSQIYKTGAIPAEFIHLISSEANEICELESKKTIAPEHIIGALKVCHSLLSVT